MPASKLAAIAATAALAAAPAPAYAALHHGWDVRCNEQDAGQTVSCRVVRMPPMPHFIHQIRVGVLCYLFTTGPCLLTRTTGLAPTASGWTPSRFQSSP